MNWELMDRCEMLLKKYDIKPVLGVIPNNKDSDLLSYPKKDDFWKQVRIWKDKGWEITQILNTHEHGDHTGGNHAVIEATGAKLIAHENAQGKIEGIDQGLKSGDVVKVGKSA